MREGDGGEDKLLAVVDWRTSTLFGDMERAALEYAERMTISGQSVDEALFARLQEHFDEAQIVDAIARTDYDQPVARQRTVAPPPGPALTREGGVFRRFIDGFRYQ